MGTKINADASIIDDLSCIGVFDRCRRQPSKAVGVLQVYATLKRILEFDVEASVCFK